MAASTFIASSSRRTLSTLVAAALAVTGLVGCRHDHHDHMAAADPAPMTAAPATMASPAPMRMANGMSTITMAYPSGERATSYAFIEKTIPAEVQVGAPFEYTITVTNLQNTLCLDEVVVSDTLPEGFTVNGSTPTAGNEAGRLQWRFPRLNPRESKVIKVQAVANRPGSITQCASVAGIPRACVDIVAVQPALQLTKVAPAEVLTCDQFDIVYTVTNSGSGTARNVVIKDTLPAGLAAVAGGSQSVSIDAGTLASKESKAFKIAVKPARTGTYASGATAAAEGGLTAAANASTVARQPVLAITQTAPATIFIDRSFPVEITVTNNGDTTAKGTALVTAVPAGVKVVSASDGAVAGADSRLNWTLGDLAPKASKKVVVNLQSSVAASVTANSATNAVCATPVNSTSTTNVVGIPALLLEVVDTVDPVPVNGETTYVITVTNQGTAVDTNIKIVGNLEDTMQFVSAAGATTGSLSGSTITFAPLPSLAPKAKAEFRVTVKAVKTGDTRFKLQMTSDQLTRPVDESESTNLYQ